MGFFDSTNTQSQTSTYQNDTLDAYTKGYRGSAPWGFATLDPTATLAAMGQSKSGTAVGGKILGADFKATLQGMSADEKKQAGDTNAALDRIRQRQESGQFLTPQETDFINQSLDKAFEYANTTGMRDITLQAQTMAGRQGLRTSDTPVAQPAMQATRDLALGIGSQRAQAGLQATMGMSAQQNAFDQSFAQFNQQLQQSRQNTRMSALFGGGLSGASNVGYTQSSYGKTTTGMSGFAQMTGMFDFAKNVAGTAGAAMGGMGAGAGASQAPGLASSQGSMISGLGMFG